MTGEVPIAQRLGGDRGEGNPRSAEGKHALPPGVEAFARLLSQLPLRHFVAQDLRGLELRLPERLVEVLGDREPDVEADEIRELERTHRMVVSQLHRLVDVFRGGDPALEHPHRFETEGQTQPAGCEPRRVLHHDRILAEGSRDRKSTRLNSSHGYISYAVFCLKKKKRQLYS